MIFLLAACNYHARNKHHLSDRVMRTQDTPVRKYLVALTVGYSERANVNATVHKVIRLKSL
jgi:hypothetical protein